MTKVLTIDGASGTGKTSLALNLADKLNYNLLLSGLLYRLVALYGEEDVLSFCAGLDSAAIKITNIAGTPELYYQNQACYQQLMEPAIAKRASLIAAKASVRSALLLLQRQFAEGPGLVAEGRDMGQVIFPNATLKVFLQADEIVRARRRAKQLQLSGKSISIDKLLNSMSERDSRDASRAISPMVCPSGALVIDTSNLSEQEVMQKIIKNLHVV